MLVFDVLHCFVEKGISYIYIYIYVYMGLSFSKFSHEEQIFTPAQLELLFIAPSRETLGCISMALKGTSS